MPGKGRLRSSPEIGCTAIPAAPTADEVLAGVNHRMTCLSTHTIIEI